MTHSPSALGSADTLPLSGIQIAPHVDARPILPRSDTNLWERTEEVRTELLRQVEETCREHGMEALVLQSDPYVHPAWVKFECWMPHGDRALTARASITVTITAMPYHRFEAVYKVEWEKQGRRGVVDQIHTFGEREVRAMVEYLCAEPRGVMGAVLRNRVNAILRPMQLRQIGWHFWKPVNKIRVLRRDWLPIGSLAALAVGGVLLAYGPSVEESSGYTTGVTASDRFEMLDTMAPFGSSGLLPDRTPDVPAIFAGQDLTLTLDRDDPRFDGGAHFEAWSYLAYAGERFVVTMRSDDLDTKLYLGQMQQGEFVLLDENDDYGGESHSRLEVTASAAGEYLILASSYRADNTGTYALRIDSGDGSATFGSEILPSESDSSGSGTGALAGVLFLLIGGVGLVGFFRAPRFIRSAGKPMAEPRVLYYLDSWPTVVFGAGGDADEIRRRVMALFSGAHQQRFACAVEKIWHWGLDGKTEREQIVLRYGRALVFCQVYSYGSDLYVGWDAQMNLGTWMEKKLASGIDRETGKRVRLMTVEHAVQPTTEYDLIDLNCLAEWTHAQITQVLKHYLKERAIDQEIDFSIIRGERKGLTDSEKKDQKKNRFRRKA